MFKNIYKKYKELSLPVKASLWLVVCGFFKNGISVITTPIFTRLLSSEEYGIYSVFTSWQSLILIIATLKLSGGVYQQGLVKFEKTKHKYTSALLGLTTTMVVVYLVAFILWRNPLSKIIKLDYRLIVAMLIAMPIMAASDFWTQQQRVDYRYKPLAALTIAIVLLRPTVSILAISLTEGNKAYARILSGLAVDTIAYLWIYISLFAKGRTFFDKDIWKYGLKLNIPLVPHYLSQTVLSSADRIMISNMVGNSESGIYNLGYQVSMIPKILTNSIADSMSPWMLKNIKANRIDKIAGRCYEVLIIVAVSSLMFILAAPEAIAIFAPESYGEAVLVVPPVVMSIYFSFLYNFFVVFEYYFEKSTYIMVASVVGALLNLLLNYIFIPILGFNAAAYTTLFCYMVYCFGHYMFLRHIEKKYLNSVSVYNIWVIILISIIYVGIGFLFMVFYKNLILRVALFLTLTLIGLLNRSRIVSILRKN